MELSTPIRSLKGIGETRAKAFARLDIETASDLLGFFPRTYEDRGNVAKLFDLPDGETASVIVTIDAPPKEARGKSGLYYVKVSASDDTGTVYITFFNNKWIASSLTTGRVFRVYGKFNMGMYGRECVNPVMETLTPQLKKIYPIYTITENLTQKIISQSVAAVLPLAESVSDVLPESIRTQFALLHRSDAIKKIHFPENPNDVKQAVRTLAFEELTVFQLSLRKLREGTEKKKAYRMSQKNSGIRGFFESLSFGLTSAQQRTVKEIFADMQKDTPMMRLVQGDVGSGKTILAVAAAYFCVKNGHQAAMMAPTEILAAQHYNTFARLLEPFGMNIVLITGSMTASRKRIAKQAIADGTANVIIGTNAVIQGDVEFASLALTITDEQHRFGVMQRASLISKGKDDMTPHTLVMSATPIPRTLSLILYGDLDISILDELPPGRQTVTTKAVSDNERDKVNEFLISEIKKGRQAFIVCPLVEESDKSEAKSASERFEEIQKELKGVRCGLLHGRMKNKEKDAVMESFRSGSIDILVSTTVIEVGVDVPNATVMVVENSERFGLSTLHQLRGRIGRGSNKSYCILVYSGKSDKSKERIETMCRTNDGFEIARTDLKLRGPGDFFGERQSGEMKFRVASVADIELVEQTRAVVDTIMEKELLSLNEYAALAEESDRLWLKNLKNNTLN